MQGVSIAVRGVRQILQALVTFFDHHRQPAAILQSQGRGTLLLVIRGLREMKEGKPLLELQYLLIAAGR